MTNNEIKIEELCNLIEDTMNDPDSVYVHKNLTESILQNFDKMKTTFLWEKNLVLKAGYHSTMDYDEALKVLNERIGRMEQLLKCFNLQGFNLMSYLKFHRRNDAKISDFNVLDFIDFFHQPIEKSVTNVSIQMPRYN